MSAPFPPPAAASFWVVVLQCSIEAAFARLFCVYKRSLQRWLRDATEHSEGGRLQCDNQAAPWNVTAEVVGCAAAFIWLCGRLLDGAAVVVDKSHEILEFCRAGNAGLPCCSKWVC